MARAILHSDMNNSLLIEEIIADVSEMRALYSRLTELMPEAITIGELRLDGLSEDAIGETKNERTGYRNQRPAKCGCCY